MHLSADHLCVCGELYIVYENVLIITFDILLVLVWVQHAPIRHLRLVDRTKVGYDPDASSHPLQQ